MRVLYFHQHFSTPKGSAGIRSYAMARSLLAAGHQVTMVCGSYSGGRTGLSGPYVSGVRRGTVEGIDVIEFELPYSNKDGFLKRSWLFLKFAIRSVKVALSEKYDLVFATTTPLTAGIPGIFAKWLRRKPFVFEVRDLWPELPKAMGVIKNPIVLAAMSLLEWLSYRSADRLVALSPGIASGIARRGVSTDRIAMIPNGCDLDIFAAPAPSWRPDGVKDSDLIAIYAGTHGIANGLSSVIAAAQVLKQRNRNDIKLILIGDGKEKEALQQRATSLGLDNVVFLPPVSKLELSGLMEAADIGMQLLANVPAFYYGTSPNKFFDYIASGKAVLNNYPGWLADIIKERQIGYAVAPELPEAFADALCSAADNRSKLKEMGGKARQLAREKFDRQILSKQFVDWLKGAVDETRI
ncbi:MAG: glycosyltransferase family 4 protein [Permianibacter sp.]